MNFPISEREPRKGTETQASVNPCLYRHIFQNVNPERGRKRTLSDEDKAAIQAISEREPRKGTETLPSLMR